MDDNCRLRNSRDHPADKRRGPEQSSEDHLHSQAGRRKRCLEKETDNKWPKKQNGNHEAMASQKSRKEIIKRMTWLI